jgi:SAM-dependent methyltransferase
MIVYIILSIILILIYCISLCKVSNKIILFILFLCTLIGINNTESYKRIEGGNAHIISNNSIENIVEKYSKLDIMINKQFKYIGKKYKPKDDFFNKMYQIYKYKPDITKKWGNVAYKQPLHIKFNNKIINILKNIKKNSSILDYGCGDGWTLNNFEDMGINNITCVDIDDYRTYAKKSTFIKNKHLSSMDSKINNNSLDLVIALQSLHHINFENDKTEFIDRIIIIIKSIISKIKSGGYLLIREHNVRNAEDLPPVLFEHLLYDLIELDDKSMSFNEIKKWVTNYHIYHNGWYFSKIFLHNMLELNGMKLKETEKKKGLNISNIYNSLYIKI